MWERKATSRFTNNLPMHLGKKEWISVQVLTLKGWLKLNFAMIKDITPSLANVDNLHDWDSSKVLQARSAHNKAKPQRFCISFTWGILGTCNKNIFLAYICFSFKPHSRYLGSNQNHQFFYYLLSLFSTLLKMSFCGYLLFKIRKYSLWNKSHLSIETSIYIFSFSWNYAVI